MAINNMDAQFAIKYSQDLILSNFTCWSIRVKSLTHVANVISDVIIVAILSITWLDIIEIYFDTFLKVYRGFYWSCRWFQSKLQQDNFGAQFVPKTSFLEPWQLGTYWPIQDRNLLHVLNVLMLAIKNLISYLITKEFTKSFSDSWE